MVAVKAGFIGPAADGTTPLENLVDTRRVETWYAMGGRQGIRSGFVYSVVSGQMQLSFTAGEALVAERDGSNNELRRGYLVWDDSTKIAQFGAASASNRNDAVVIAVVDVEDGAQGTGAIGVGGHIVVVPGVSGTTTVRTASQIQAYLGRGGWVRVADVAIPSGSTQISAGNIVQSADAYTVSYVEKPTDQSVTSSTTLVDDTALKVTLPIGRWRVEAHLIGYSASDFGDMGVAWSFTGTNADGPYRVCHGPQMSISATDSTATLVRMSANHGLTTTINYGMDGAVSSYIHEDMRMNVTASGLLMLRWAQANSSFNASVMKAGSRLYFTRLS